MKQNELKRYLPFIIQQQYNFLVALDITVFVRDEKKIPEHIKEKVKVIVGDATNPEQVEKAIAGQEAVVVVLGTRNDLSKASNIFIASNRIFYRKQKKTNKF